MDSKLGERLAHSLITVLAFGVGILLGPRLCTPAPQDGVQAPDLEVAEQLKEEPAPDASTPCEDTCEVCPAPQVIYECPPKPKPEPVKGVKTGKKKKLPPPEPELDPLARKRLLAWVRDQSDVLKSCRDDAQQVYRMAVIMQLDPKSGAVKRVSVNASRGVVPAQVMSCVRQKVRAWRPPKDLTNGRTKLVFGLTI